MEKLTTDRYKLCRSRCDHCGKYLHFYNLKGYTIPICLNLSCNFGKECITKKDKLFSFLTELD